MPEELEERGLQSTTGERQVHRLDSKLTSCFVSSAQLWKIEVQIFQIKYLCVAYGTEGEGCGQGPSIVQVLG